MTVPVVPTPQATEVRVLQKVKSSIASMEAKILSALDSSGVSETSSPGAILEQMVSHPQQTLRSIALKASAARVQFKLMAKEAKAELNASIAYGNHLRSVASYLDGSLDLLPESMPSDLKLLARTAKAGLLAGLIETSLPGLIRKRADQGLSRLSAASEHVDKVISAGRVARLSASHRLYQRCAKCEDLTETDQARAKVLVSFVAKHLAKAKTGHSKTFFKRT